MRAAINEIDAADGSRICGPGKRRPSL